MTFATFRNRKFLILLLATLMVLALVFSLGSWESEKLNRLTYLYIKRKIERRYFFDLAVERVQIKLLPLAIKLDGLHLYREKTAEELVTIDHLRIKISWLRFLARQIYVSDTYVEGVRVFFPIEDQHIFFDRKRKKPRGFFRTYMGRVEVKDGYIKVFSRATPFTAEIKQVDVSLKFKNLLRVIAGEVRLQSFRVKQKDFPASAQSGELRLELYPNSMNIKKYAFYSPETKLQLNGRLKEVRLGSFIPGLPPALDFLDTPELTLKAQVAPKSPVSLRDFLADIELSVRQGAIEGRTLTSLYLSGLLTKRYFTIHKANFEFNGGRLSGDGQFRFTRERGYRMQVKLDDFNPQGLWAADAWLTRHVAGPLQVEYITRGGLRHDAVKNHQLIVRADPLKLEWVTASRKKKGLTLPQCRFSVDGSSERGAFAFPQGKLTTGPNAVDFSGHWQKASGLNLTFKGRVKDLNRIKTVAWGPLGGSLEGAGTARGELKNPRVEGTYHAAGLRWGRYLLTAAAGSFRWEDFVFSSAESRVGSGANPIVVKWHWPIKNGGREFTLKVDAPHTSWAELGPIAGRSLPLSGPCGLYVDLRRKNSRFNGRIKVEASRLRVFNDEFQNAYLEFLFPGTQDGLLTTELHKGQGMLSIKGTMTPDYYGRFDFSGRNLSLRDFAVLSASRFQPQGRLNFQGQAFGRPRDPQLKAAIQLREAALKDYALPDADWNVEFKNRQWEVTVNSASGTESLQGSCSAYPPYRYSLAIDFKRTDLKPIFNLFTFSRQFTGLLRGRLTGSGEVQRPAEARFTLAVDELTAEQDKISLHNIKPFAVSYLNGQINLPELTFANSHGELNVSGKIMLRKEYNIKVNGEMDLSLLPNYLPRVSRAAGQAVVGMQIQGAWAAPRIQGALEINRGELYLLDFPQSLENISGQGFFNENHLFVEKVSGVSGGGKWELTGDIELARFKPKAYNLRMDLYQVNLYVPMWLPTQDSGYLQLTGVPERLRLEGELEVEKALYSNDLNWEDLIFNFNRRLYEPRSLRESQVTLDLDLRAKESIMFDNNVGKGTLGGAININGPANRPNLLGTLEVVEGKINFRDNVFELTSGSIEFIDPFRLNPYFDINATTKKRDYDIYLNLIGYLSQYRILLSSNPALDQMDIVALLSLGATRAELGQSGDTFNSRTLLETSSLFTGPWQSSMEGEVKENFGFDTFHVKPYYSDSTSSAGTRITVGKQLRENLYVTYDRIIAGTNENEVALDYKLHRNITLSGGWNNEGDNREGNISAYLKFRFEFQRWFSRFSLRETETQD